MDYPHFISFQDCFSFVCRDPICISF